jgi:imidazolonepropionase-like amidohydrolase
VVPTLAAFGGGADTLANLTALHDAGAAVLYGTDFGNTRTPGIQAAELRAMRDAGLSSAEILAAGTSTPAAQWGFDGLGEIAVGARASLLVLEADPLADPLTLADPVQVWVDGVRR